MVCCIEGIKGTFKGSPYGQIKKIVRMVVDLCVFPERKPSIIGSYLKRYTLSPELRVWLNSLSTFKYDPNYQME